MDKDDKASKLKKLGDAMRADWDRRIRHDYRFWMSDGHKDDEAMWSAGARDFEILCRGIDGVGKSILDLGCGVGRLLKPALRRFSSVIGIDVSKEAIEKARELVGDNPKLTTYQGDGITLAPLANSSVDVVISFAALVSMPTDVIAQYFVEAHRVLKPDGHFRLQFYLGVSQQVGQEDTLHLRCFEEQNFRAAVQAAGFSVEWIEELKLPFQVSFDEIGVRAVTISLVNTTAQAACADEVAKLLLPEGEQQSSEALGGSDLEYWMTLQYAHQLAEKGEVDKARATLEFASTFASKTTLDVRELLDQILAKLASGENGANLSKDSTEFYTKNLEVLKTRFPEVVSLLSDSPSSTDVEVNKTDEGPVLLYKGQHLDHPTRPIAAASSWVKRVLHPPNVKNAKSYSVFGFACGYHIEELLNVCSSPVGVIEPKIEIFEQALRSRDLTPVLKKIDRLCVGDMRHDSQQQGCELLIRPQHSALFPDFIGTAKTSFYGTRGLASLHPTIGVVGPLQGGTLPITAYTIRALQSLKQRVREFDTSGFAPTFHHIDKFFFDKYRTAAVHGHYIQFLSHVLLESMNEKPVDILIFMAQAPISAPMLTELRKRGTVLVLWFMEDYLRFTYWRELAPYFDYIFTIQRGECIEQIKKAGTPHVHYLPAACDPGIHQPIALSEEERNRWGSPVSFVGAGYHNRQQMFASLAEFPFKIWGTEWPTCRPFDKLVQEQGRRLTPGEYIKIFNSTDVNINLHSSTERDGVEPHGDFVNPRTLELAAAGAFQLVDERSLLAEMFIPGKEIITFKDLPDLKEKIRYYLNHPEERKLISERTRARALAEHTYAQRLEQMLSIIYSSKYETLKLKEEKSPWSKMLSRAERFPELHSRCKAAFDRGEEPILDGLVADIVSGKGKLTETEQKLLFLFHVRKQIIRMRVEELGPSAPQEVRRGGL